MKYEHALQSLLDKATDCVRRNDKKGAIRNIVWAQTILGDIINGRKPATYTVDITVTDNGVDKRECVKDFATKREAQLFISKYRIPAENDDKPHRFDSYNMAGDLC